MCYSKSKIPINPNPRRGSLGMGSYTNPVARGTLSTCLSHIGQMASVESKGEYIREPVLGAGIVTGNGLGCIDLDDTVGDDGTIDEQAQEIIDQMDSYTEISVSRRGIHIFFRCEEGLEFNRNLVYLDDARTKVREIYTKIHFIAITGNTIPGHDTIQPRTEQAKAVYAEYYRPFELMGYGSNAPKVMVKTGISEITETSETTEGEAIRAIQNHDAGFFQKVLQEPPREFNSSEDFFNYLYRYPLSDFLGVPERRTFCCFFHNDNTPSASVFQTGKGTGIWLYRCHSEGLNLTIKQLVQQVGGFETEQETLEFLKECLNIQDVQDEWILRQQQRIDGIMDFMWSTGDDGFSSLCPTASSTLRWGKGIYLSVLAFAREHLLPSIVNPCSTPVFFASLTDLCVASGKTDKDKVDHWLKCFAYHGILKPLQDSQVPKESLERAKKIAKDNKRRRHVSYFQIDPLNPAWIEHQAKSWKSHGYKINAVSYELFFRTEGEEVAKILYPQRFKTPIATLGREGNDRAERRHDLVHDVAEDLLKKLGYIRRDDVVNAYVNNGYGDRETAILQVNRSLPEITQSFGLTRRKANKALKAKYGIEGYPFIFVPKEEA